VCAKEVSDATRSQHEVCAAIVSDWSRDGEAPWSHEVLRAGLEFGAFAYQTIEPETEMEEIGRRLRGTGRRPDWKRVREALRAFLDA
jgi:hypothetical protein